MLTASLHCQYKHRAVNDACIISGDQKSLNFDSSTLTTYPCETRVGFARPT